MIEYEMLQALLSDGANAATMIMVYLIWRLDRRLVKVETTLHIEGDS